MIVKIDSHEYTHSMNMELCVKELCCDKYLQFSAVQAHGFPKRNNILNSFYHDKIVFAVVYKTRLIRHGGNFGYISLFSNTIA